MTTPSFRTCNAGHYYAASLKECPYCQERKSNPETQTVNNDDKTMIMGGGKITPDPDNAETRIVPSPFGGSVLPVDTGDDKTQIYRPGKQTGSEGHTKTIDRKLEGWLVSFTLDPMGVDFRLFEGQNKIGRDASCNVRLVQDATVSSHHATLLFRNGTFYLRDEMASNSSYVNDAEVLPNSTVALKDGDRLRLGAHTFLLRTAAQ
jgi:hypothetical protein